MKKLILLLFPFYLCAQHDYKITNPILMDSIPVFKKAEITPYDYGYKFDHYQLLDSNSNGANNPFVKPITRIYFKDSLAEINYYINEYLKYKDYYEITRQRLLRSETLVEDLEKILHCLTIYGTPASEELRIKCVKNIKNLLKKYPNSYYVKGYKNKPK